VDLVRGGTDRQAHPDFAASYQAIARRRGKKIATTAIARRLLTRAWHLLTDAGLTSAPQATATASASAAPSSRGDAFTDREGSPSPGRARKPHEPAMPRSMT
jgi:hypothetical protein